MILSHFVRDEVQRDAVVAIAQSCWSGAVLKDVALVTPTARAVIFCPGDNQFEVALRVYGALDHIIKAWPARAGVKLHVRFKKRLPAPGAAISP